MLPPCVRIGQGHFYNISHTIPCCSNHNLRIRPPKPLDVCHLTRNIPTRPYTFHQIGMKPDIAASEQGGRRMKSMEKWKKREGYTIPHANSITVFWFRSTFKWNFENFLAADYQFEFVTAFLYIAMPTVLCVIVQDNESFMGCIEYLLTLHCFSLPVCPVG